MPRKRSNGNGRRRRGNNSNAMLASVARPVLDFTNHLSRRTLRVATQINISTDGGLTVPLFAAPVNGLSTTRYPAAVSSLAVIYLESRLTRIQFLFDNRQGGSAGATVSNPRVYSAVFNSIASGIDPTPAELIAKYRPGYTQFRKDAHNHKIGPEYGSLGQFQFITTNNNALGSALIVVEGYSGTVRIIETFEFLGPPDDIRALP